jgi:putative aldouronate transport system permease protein
MGKAARLIPGRYPLELREENMMKSDKRFRRAFKRFNRERELWLIAIPLIVWVAVFHYYPMYGLSISFLRYVPGRTILGSPWVGLQNFTQFFLSPDFVNVLRNTLAISGLGILLGFPAPIILALLLNELRSAPFKRVTQTISYLPHFISWVVTASLVFALLGNEGLVNDLLERLNGQDARVPFLTRGEYFWWLITFVNIWKSIGWSSIIYLSAIAGIDPELYAAASVDGVGRFGSMWHVTLPSILPTIILLWILGIGNILNAGFEQQLLLGNPQTREYYEVIDTYAYKYGIQLGRYSYATAVGFFKSLIGLALVFTTNRISKKAFDLSIM